MEILKFRKDALSEWREIVALKGEDGYTPVKGVDYFTEEDKEEFTNSISLTNYATKDYVDSLPHLTEAQVQELIDNSLENIEIDLPIAEEGEY